MAHLNCPSCGAKVEFKSTVSLYTVCAYCRSYLFRGEEHFENMGKMADLPEDSSPLQIGASGIYMNKSFTIVGKNKMKWEDGFWNEWYLNMQDGTPAWLAEAQGEFILNFEQKGVSPSSLPRRSDIKIGQRLSLQNQTYTIVDIKNAECCGSEGELPFRAVPGEKRFSVDLRSTQGEVFSSLEFDETAKNDECRLYVGRYISLRGLQMKFLREFDGW